MQNEKKNKNIVTKDFKKNVIIIDLVVAIDLFLPILPL